MKSVFRNFSAFYEFNRFKIENMYSGLGISNGNTEHVLKCVGHFCLFLSFPQFIQWFSFLLQRNRLQWIKLLFHSKLDYAVNLTERFSEVCDGITSITALL